MKIGRGTWSLIVVALVAALWLPDAERSAHAQPQTTAMGESKQKAINLATEAIEDMKQGRYEAACRKFYASLDLYDDQRTLVNLASCYEHTSQYLSAVAAYKRAIDRTASHPDPPRATIEALLTKLSARIPTLTINVTPSAAFAVNSIEVDGAPLAKERWGTAVEMNPGAHQVVAKSNKGSTIWRTGEGSLVLKDRARGVVTIPGFTPETVKQVERLYALSASGNKALVEGRIEELCASVEEYIKIYDALPQELRDSDSEKENAGVKRQCDGWPDKRAVSLVTQAIRIGETMKPGDSDGMDKLRSMCSKIAEAVKRHEEAEWLRALGTCQRKLGKTASADRTWTRGLELATQQKDEERATAIRQDRENLAPHLSYLTIRLTKESEGMSVALRSLDPDETSIIPKRDWGKRLIVNPGAYEVIVAARDDSWKKSVTVGEDGASEVVELPPPPEEVWTPAPDVPTVPPGSGGCACDTSGGSAAPSVPGWTVGLALVLVGRRRPKRLALAARAGGTSPA